MVRPTEPYEKQKIRRNSTEFWMQTLFPDSSLADLYDPLTMPVN